MIAAPTESLAKKSSERNVEKYLVAAAAVYTIGNLIGVKIDIGMWREATKRRKITRCLRC